MIIFNITIPQPKAEERMLQYKVSIEGTQIYAGKIYTAPNQETVTLDLTDILLNHRFRGNGVIAPVLDVANNQYSMPNYNTTIEHTKVQNYIYSRVTVSGDYITTSNRYVNFNTMDIAEQPFMDVRMTPIIPAVLPTGFKLNQLFNAKGEPLRIMKNATSFITISDNNNYTYNFPNAGGYTMIDYQGMHYDMYVKDECLKPYYLIWQTKWGGMQCQPFTKRSVKTSEHSVNKRVDMSGYQWNANDTKVDKYDLKSRLLTNKEYKIFGEMFDSPYLVLLDMDNNALRYVTITDTTYTEKNTGNQDKPFYFEVNVQTSEHKSLY